MNIADNLAHFDDAGLDLMFSSMVYQHVQNRATIERYIAEFFMSSSQTSWSCSSCPATCRPSTGRSDGGATRVCGGSECPPRRERWLLLRTQVQDVRAVARATLSAGEGTHAIPQANSTVRGK